MVSFSVTSRSMNEQPYALFGGYNSSQIVGGSTGLKTFRNFENHLGTWALEGQGMSYNGKNVGAKEDPSYPAIIDTGSSQLSVPPDVFAKIQKAWAKDLPEIDCETDKTFCFANKPCEDVGPKMRNVGF